MIAAILGLSGPVLTADERAFFRSVDPAGFILFRRNCVDRAQMRALTDSLRACVGRDRLAILIDQEGGRVQRMTAPEWPRLPAAERFDLLYRRTPVAAMEAARLNARMIGAMLREVGVTVDCLPLLDVRRPDADAVIGDRALGSDPMQVASLGRAVLDGLREGGVAGVMKHLPGHGRTSCDTHLALPRVTATAAELEEDIAPFRALAPIAPMGMTAHMIFDAWDAARPATLSPAVIGAVVRDRIGFDGLLMSDDLGMHALSGGFDARTEAAIAAGCDIALHCSGDRAEMEAVARAAPDLAGVARDRLERALGSIADDAPALDIDALTAKRDALLALA